MTDLPRLVEDLEAEQEALDAVVGPLDADGWATRTPAEGWTVADQIAHLSYFDGAAATAIEDADAFRRSVEELLASGDLDGGTLRRGAEPGAVLAGWRSNRARLAAALEHLDESARLPWYGPPMGAKSFVTARLMECWAHGQDVRDALGLPPEATDRLRHIARLGVLTRGWSYVNRGLEPPDVPVRVELTSPAGELWTFGPDDAPEVVRATAVDFCLVVTQRRHVDETDLEAVGDAARDWMEKAQAFAGQATQRPAREVRE